MPKLMKRCLIGVSAVLMIAATLAMSAAPASAYVFGPGFGFGTVNGHTVNLGAYQISIDGGANTINAYCSDYTQASPPFFQTQFPAADFTDGRWSYLMWRWGTNPPDAYYAAAVSILGHWMGNDGLITPGFPDSSGLGNMTVSGSPDNVYLKNLVLDLNNQADLFRNPGVSASLNPIDPVTGTATGNIHIQSNSTGVAIAGAFAAYTGTSNTNSQGFVGPSDANGDIAISIQANDHFQPASIHVLVGGPGQFAAAWDGPGTQVVYFTQGTFPLEADASAPAAPMATARVFKQSNNTAYQPVTGTQFDLWKDDANNYGTFVATMTVDASGFSNIVSGLVPGNYRVIETTTPVGLVPAGPWEFVLNAGDQFTLTANNSAVQQGQINLVKLDASTQQPVAGATLVVDRDSDNNGSYDQNIGSYQSAATPVNIPNLLQGNYQVTETVAPPGYTLPAQPVQQFFLAFDQNITVTFQDVGNGSAQVHKTSNNLPYQSVAGAQFELRRDDANNYGTVIGTMTTNAAGDTNALTGLSPGNYRIIETVTPAGLTTDPSGPWDFPLAPGQSYVQQVNDPAIRTSLGLAKVQGGGGGGGGATVADLQPANPGDPLAGAHLLVKFDADNNGSYETTIGTYVTTANGGLNVPNLLAGNYQVTEVVAPTGYTLPEQTVQTVTLVYNAIGQVTFQDVAPEITTQASTQFAAPGIPFHDTATVTGPATVTTGKITTTLYGPFTPGAAFVCDTAHAVQTVTADVTGAGSFNSPNVQTSKPGIYTFVETWESTRTGDTSSATHPCGDVTETVASPSITTQASTQQVGPGAPIHDTGILTGVPNGQSGVITTTLYGPFPAGSTGATLQCTAAHQVWTGTTTTSGSGSFPSPSYTPTDYGVYTYVESWVPTGVTPVPPPITHTCGTPPETTTISVPTISTEASTQDSLVGSPIHDTGVLTGVPDGVTGTIHTVLYGPFPKGSTGSALVCDTAHKVWEGDTATTGSGSFPSPEFVSTAPGVYTYMESWTPTTGKFPPITHTCGQPPETTYQRASVNLTGHKFDQANPSIPVQGATYDLFLSDPSALPATYTPATTTPGDVAAGPTGSEWWARATTDANGNISMSVPAGGTWCFVEQASPAGWEMDTTPRCTTGAVDETTPVADLTLALPEAKTPGGGPGGSTPGGGGLPFTGSGSTIPLTGGGVALVIMGSGLFLITTRRRATS